MVRVSHICTAITLLSVFKDGAAPAFSAEKSAEPPPKSLEIMVEDSAPPWSRADGKGFANDVVEAAFREMDVAVDLKVVPYARCKKSVLKGKVVACFSMTWHKEFEGLIRLSRFPLISVVADVFENKKKPLPRPASGTCALPAGTRVGTVQAYEYPRETMALLDGDVKFEGYLSDIQTLKMLASGRLDAAIVMTNTLQPRNQKAVDAKVDQSVQFAFNCGQEVGTIGFSLKHPGGPAAFALYEEGYQKLMKSGRLKTLTVKWERLLASPTAP